MKDKRSLLKSCVLLSNKNVTEAEGDSDELATKQKTREKAEEEPSAVGRRGSERDKYTSLTYRTYRTSLTQSLSYAHPI